MAETKEKYSHSPVDEKNWTERNITVQDGNFGRVIARACNQDNADMIVKALNLAQEREPFMTIRIDKENSRVVLCGQSVRWTGDMTEKILRDSIIELGWTPPKDNNNQTR